MVIVVLGGFPPGPEFGRGELGVEEVVLPFVFLNELAPAVAEVVLLGTDHSGIRVLLEFSPVR